MKLLTLSALIIAPVFAAVAVVSSSADTSCMDLGSTSDTAFDPTIQASKHKGQLYVKLNRATNLKDKDWFGKSDPFIEMWLEKSYKHRSKDTKGLNPVFDETFCFYVRPGQDKLHVRVVDKDTFRNDKIGDTSISLTNVFNTGREGPKDYNLPKWLGLRSNGHINMQMQFVEDRS